MSKKLDNKNDLVSGKETSEQSELEKINFVDFYHEHIDKNICFMCREPHIYESHPKIIQGRKTFWCISCAINRHDCWYPEDIEDYVNLLRGGSSGRPLIDFEIEEGKK
ncbi:MAG: hypothetical protein ACTSYA_01695 [Candidatus Kariarchaeaceae archaeon]